MKSTTTRGPLPIDPMTCAVIVVDSQNDYYGPDGALAPPNPDNLLAHSVPGQQAVLRAATAGNRLVVFIRDVTRPDHLTSSPAKLFERLRTRRNNALASLDWGYENTPGSEVYGPVKEAAPQGIEVFKSRNSAFVDTALDLVLRSNGIRTVFVIGVATDVCVAATTRDAADHGYRSIVVREAVGGFKPELHAAALRLFEAHWEVADLSTAVALLADTTTGNES